MYIVVMFPDIIALVYLYDLKADKATVVHFPKPTKLLLARIVANPLTGKKRTQNRSTNLVN